MTSRLALSVARAAREDAPRFGELIDDGKWVVIVGSKMSVLLRADGTRMGRVKIPEGFAGPVFFSPDGKELWCFAWREARMTRLGVR